MPLLYFIAREKRPFHYTPAGKMPKLTLIDKHNNHLVHSISHNYLTIQSINKPK